MNWSHDLFTFLSVPILITVLSIVLYRGKNPRRFKIVREFNKLGEEQFEVWFDYPASPLVRSTWTLKETFATLELAEEYIARQHRQRETVQEGSL